MVTERIGKHRMRKILNRRSANVIEDFILPGGGAAASACHLARTIIRRAERRVSTLMKEESPRPEVLRYLNRLSDLLFVIARVLARRESGEEILWQRDRG